MEFKKRTSKRLTQFMTWSSHMAGKPISFVIAWSMIILWIITGLIFGFTDSWLLAINTVATLNASLMVFIIQNTQTRESKALHIKIDGLIKAIKEAENELIAIENLEEEELEALRNKLKKLTQ